MDNDVNEGNLDAVRSLVQQGADVNEGDKIGFTHLMTAAFTGQPEMVRLLLELGADPNATTSSGRTALDVVEGVVDTFGGYDGHEEVFVILSSGA